MASSPDLTCMDKPLVLSFRSYGGTSCGSLPVLSSSVFGTVSVTSFAVVSFWLFYVVHHNTNNNNNTLFLLVCFSSVLFCVLC